MSTHGVRCQCDSSNLIVLPVSFVGCFDLRSFNALSTHRVSSDHKRNCETSGRGGSSIQSYTPDANMTGQRYTHVLYAAA